MRLHKLIFLISISVIFFLYSCKSTETAQSKEKAMNEQTREEVLQSEVDTSPPDDLTSFKLGEGIILANRAADLFCKMKMYEEKDMSNINISNAHDKLNQEYILVQEEVSKLSSTEKEEYTRVFEKSIEKCR